MGAGRKTQTFTLPANSETHWTSTSCVNARNIRKSELGGVIFGCKHSTMKECYSRRLFGLPGPHFIYVRNIDPGLPLFLFNYSDRTLHGIFEAATVGQLRIEPHAWTPNDSDYTSFPAQVRIRTQMQCQPLTETQFNPIIKENYYEDNHFYFELDRVQTKKLISLFSSSPTTASAALPMNNERENTRPKASSIGKDEKRGDNGEFNALNVTYPNQNNNKDASFWDEPSLDLARHMVGTILDDEGIEEVERMGRSLKTNIGCSYSNVVPSAEISGSQKSWSSLFKGATTLDAGKKTHVMQAPVLESNLSGSGESDWGWESRCFDHVLDENRNIAETVVGDLDKNQEHVGLRKNSGVLNSFIPGEGTTYFTHSVIDHTIAIGQSEEESKANMIAASELNLPYIIDANMDRGFAHFNKGSHPSEAAHAKEVIDKEPVGFRSNGECTSFSPVMKQIVPNNNQQEEARAARIRSNDILSPESANVLEMESSDVYSIMVKLLGEVKELSLSHLEQEKKISLLEHDVVKSRLEIQLLKDRWRTLECPSFQKTGSIKESQSTNDPHPRPKESILIVGGHNGSSWLSATDCYDPSLDHMESRRPMSIILPHSSATKLNSEVYVLGGGLGNQVWHDEVESYNPLTNKWTSFPSLRRKKGNLAAVSFNDKIYAIGGGNGIESLSEMDIYLLDIGMWISTQSMLQKRFSLGAAEINGVIYAVGGYDGKEYLSSAERFDPRERYWTRLESMPTKRGCHSLVVLNEKLFAVGGYDSERMVSTVDVFDPRRGSWMVGDTMKNSRGYSTAVVCGEAIYALGGLKENGEVEETVEIYKEGHGWQATNLKGIGKRCFFSAIVL